jgi:hypothetical protein
MKDEMEISFAAIVREAIREKAERMGIKIK